MSRSLKLILSVNPVKNRGTKEGGEGQPEAFISREQGTPRSKLMVGIPGSDLAQTDERVHTIHTLLPVVAHRRKWHYFNSILY